MECERSEALEKQMKQQNETKETKAKRITDLETQVGELIQEVERTKEGAERVLPSRQVIVGAETVQELKATFEELQKDYEEEKKSNKNQRKSLEVCLTSLKNTFKDLGQVFFKPHKKQLFTILEKQDASPQHTGNAADH